jgi:hypothetical protein
MFRAVTIGAGLLLLFPTMSLANPISVDHVDALNCDFLVVPFEVDELGIAPAFTTVPDELISAIDTTTALVACPLSDTSALNALVSMTNLSSIPWRDVWYVADSPPVAGAVGTTISNFDGLVNDFPLIGGAGHAFKIDAVGANTPLVFESLVADGIFAPGETWEFIIDDYVNTGGFAASLFDSLGVASASPGGPPSSGSIIGVPVPEPGTFVLLFAGCAMLAIRAAVKRRKS